MSDTQPYELCARETDWKLVKFARVYGGAHLHRNIRKELWALGSLAYAWRRAGSVRLVWIATRPGILTPKELRLFCAYGVQQLSQERQDRTTPICAWAATVLKLHAHGRITDRELVVARSEFKLRYTAPRAWCKIRFDIVDGAFLLCAVDAAKLVFNRSYSRATLREQLATWLRLHTEPDFTEKPYIPRTPHGRPGFEHSRV